MSPTIAPRVEIDDQIRQRPDLAAAVQQATARLVDGGASIGPDVTISWRLPPVDPTMIELAITESTPSGVGVGRQRFPVRYMFDTVNRDISVRGVWDDVLAARIDRGLRRLGELITRIEVEDEEAVHAG